VPERVNLLGLNRTGLEDLFCALGERSYRANQVLKWIHQRGVCDFGPMTNISKGLRARLAVLGEIRAPQVAGHRVSRDGTQKWLMRIDAHNHVETVFIPEEERATLCVSSQIGCALNCSFCATARQGFNRNLTSAEIIGQLWLATRLLGSMPGRPREITNVVMMGMGEPLLNFDNVTRAMDIMLDDNAYGLGRKRVTLSTAGVVPGIRRLKERCPVSLAVSLHAANDALRDTLVPLNRSYPIAVVLDACRDYVLKAPKDSITFEYVMLDGVNDTEHDARLLARLLASVPAKVNLIPFNPFPGTDMACSGGATIDRFRRILMDAGLITITRKTRGDDIDAACGQLAGRVRPKALRVARRRGILPAAAAPSAGVHD